MDFLRELELAERRDEQDRLAKLEAAKARREAQGDSADDVTASADTTERTTKRSYSWMRLKSDPSIRFSQPRRTTSSRNAAACPKPSEEDARRTQEAAHQLAGILRAAKIEQEQTQSSFDEETRGALALEQLSGTKRHNFEWQSARTAAPKRRKIQVVEAVPETVESLLPGIVAIIAARSSTSTAVGSKAVAVKVDAEASPEAAVVKAYAPSPEEDVKSDLERPISPMSVRNSISAAEPFGNSEAKPKGKGKAEDVSFTQPKHPQSPELVHE
ncbi:hypothetical protein DFP72DRAFT_852288 [Ephemerocybe angulata]|uniref:Uncharacterized protein n=1 Tax=Ephemerocybe angulata TaxID=980116 RepID=A0A8H6M1E6_9AGAR|nr:hypothetical protein DFP72DRAFT_852288 [Tulosesus angulatus]